MNNKHSSNVCSDLENLYDQVIPVTTDNFLNQSFHKFILYHPYIYKVFNINFPFSETLKALSKFNHYKEYFILINNNCVFNCYLINISKPYDLIDKLIVQQVKKSNISVDEAYIVYDEDILSIFSNKNYTYHWIFYLCHNCFVEISQAYISGIYKDLEFVIKSFDGICTVSGYIENCYARVTIADINGYRFNVSKPSNFFEHPFYNEICQSLQDKVSKYFHYILAKLLLQKL